MGMSASQARLLTLTARLSDLEYSAQNISNTKVRLADQSEDAATLYTDALNKEKLSVYSSDTNSYIDATAANLTSYQGVSSLDKQRLLVNNGGQIGVSKSVAEAFAWAGDANNTTTSSYEIRSKYDDTNEATGLENCLMANVQNYPDGDYDEKLIAYYTNLWNGSEDFLWKIDPNYTTDPYPDPEFTDAKYDSSMSQYYTNLFIEMESHGYFVIDGSNMNDSDWLHTQLNNGTLYIKNWDYDGGKEGTGDFVNVPWQSGDATLKQQNDDSGIAKAEAEYDMTMARINSKETRLDLELKQIDTEHNAVQTEIESVKKVIDKNIQRTFKIFDA